ncbi:hypothetical protein D9M72_632580 [compost metagenome]
MTLTAPQAMTREFQMYRPMLRLCQTLPKICHWGSLGQKVGGVANISEPDLIVVMYIQ